MATPARLDPIIENLRTNWGGDLQGEYLDWSHRTSVTYGFPGPFDVRGEEAYGAISLPPSHQTQARLAFELWDDLIPLNLNESAPGRAPDIQFSYSLGAAGAHTDVYSVGNQITRADVWLPGISVLNEPTFGSFAFSTYLHEAGHALGLTHGGPYDASDPIDPTYADDALFTEDTEQYSVMSYFGAWESGANHWGADGIWKYASTPLLHDIAAIQVIYGADTDTRYGDTTYGFNSNAGKVIDGTLVNPYDFRANPFPVFAIWDGRGNDTIDASGYSVDQRINLGEGAFSSVGGLTDNIAIAYNCEIENAIGGSGDDTIWGNSLVNRLEGGRGDDTLIAGAGPGRDTLIGGSGNDILMGSGGDYLVGGLHDDTYYVTAGDMITEHAGEGWDTVHTTLSSYRMDAYVNELVFRRGELSPTINHTAYGNAQENTIRGAAGNDTFYGDGEVDYLFGGEGNDTLNGGRDGDFLFGEQGNDTLRGDGGIDRLVGGQGNDTLNGGNEGDFLFGEIGNDTLRGDAGSDRLVGGAGKDSLTGGADSDTFAFNSTGDSWVGSSFLSGAPVDYSDTITDFVHGVDVIDLSAIDANPLTAADDPFRPVWNPASYVGDWTGKLWVEHTSSGGSTPFGSDLFPLLSSSTLYVSTDADPMAEFQVNFSSRVTLTGVDFLY